MKDKSGHVYPRGKTWTFVIELPPDPKTGERRQLSRGGYKYDYTAYMAMQEVIDDIAKGVYTPEVDFNVAEYFEYYLKYLRNRVAQKKMKLTTLETYEYIIDARIVPFLGKIKLKKLTAEDIEELFVDMKDAEYSDSYIHGIFRVIRTALRLAYNKWDFIDVDIMKKVDAPPNPRVEKRTWTLEQCNYFLSGAKVSQYYDLYFHFIYTGKRRGEVLGLAEIDVGDKMVTINQTLTYSSKRKQFIVQEPKTPKSKRELPINDDLDKIIKNRILQNKINKLKSKYSEHDKWGLVYCESDGSPIMPSKLRYDYEKIIEQNGLPYISTHELRHSFATNLWELGYDLKDISELLGHSSVTITSDIYTHMRHDKKESVMDGFTKALNKAKAVDN